ncbi:MAG TPA: hypothetical protein PLO62_05385, partial [Candidatus Hydrogenedentes bacterium]|nr:hypothetical protein [Candidatus Hydrogenedentota bacterium]
MQKKIDRRSDQRTPGAAVVTLSGKTTLSHGKSFIAPNQNLTPEARLVVVLSAPVEKCAGGGLKVQHP